MLISKDEEIKTSTVYIGYLILKELRKKEDGRITIYEVAEVLKKQNIIHYRQLIFSLMFLYSCGLIDFREPYIYKI